MRRLSERKVLIVALLLGLAALLRCDIRPFFKALMASILGP